MADIKFSDETKISALALDDRIPIIDMSAGPLDRHYTPEQMRDLITPRGYIFGLKIANNGTDAANDIDIAGGEAQAESHDNVMTLSGTIVKRLDAAWAVGTNQGGLNTGAEAANTWYEVHLIKRTDTGVVDVMFTTTANRTTLPTNYDKQRRIGWIRNDGSSNILAFTQVEDHFTLVTPINDVGVAFTTTLTAVTLTVPPNTIARVRAGGGPFTTSGVVGALRFYEAGESTSVAPSTTDGNASLGLDDSATYNAGHYDMRVNASSQISHDSTTVGVGALDISTYGWIDYRRRLDAV
jgi:hypothetical protein